VAELILMRHAAALSAAIGATDFERPLSVPGRAAAAQAARRLSAAGVSVEQLLYSPAKRTWDTARIVAQELGLEAAALVSIPELYNASPLDIRQAIERFHGGAQGLMVIGHNPGLSDFGRELGGGLSHDHLPTSAFWRLPFDAGSWQHLTRPPEGKAR
jgi:phosphohistidine phosphatase